MKLTGENIINATPQEVWRALNDPAILRQAIPGCESLDKLSDNQFKATVKTTIGPVSAKFNGEVELSDLDPPNGYTISGKGSGGVAGNARGGAKVRLEPAGAGTRLSYDVDAQVTGKLAQLGSRLIDSTAKMLATQFFNKFGQIVGHAEAPAAIGAAVVAASSAGGHSGHAARDTGGPVWQPEQESVPAWFWAAAIAVFSLIFGFYFKH